MQRLRTGLATLIIVWTPWTGALACAAGQARYVQAGRDDVTAVLAPAGEAENGASDLLFVLSVGDRQLRFRFEQLNGYGGIALTPLPGAAQAPEADAGQDMLELRFLPYNADFTEIIDPPRKGSLAPAFIVTPELGPALWYDHDLLGAGQRRIELRRSAFVLKDCRPAESTKP